MIDHEAERYEHLVGKPDRIFLTMYGSDGDKNWMIFDADDISVARGIANEVAEDHCEEDGDLIMCYVMDVTDTFENWVSTGSFSAEVDAEVTRRWVTLDLDVAAAAFLHPTLQGGITRR